MTELIHLEEGRSPWEPSADARLIQVLDEFNVPTAGVLEQQGQPFLFRCIDGYTENLSIWVYAPLSEALIERGGFDDTLAAVLSNAPAVNFALAQTDRGIVRIAEKVDLRVWPSLITAAVDVLNLTTTEQESIGIDEQELLGS